MRALALLALCVLVAACGGGAKPKKVVKKKAVPGKVGAACKATGAMQQGTCAEGLICGPLPGGYCLQPTCPCGDGASCTETLKAGELCLKACVSDGDCRKGYTCDPSWSSCVVAGMAAPRAPVCDQVPEAPAKKLFGPAKALSSANGPGKYQTEPSGALLKDGTLVATWIANVPFAPNSLGVATVAVKGEGVPETELKTDRSFYFDPWMATDRAGKLYLAYLGFDGGMPEQNMTVGVVTSDDGKTWSAPVSALAADDCPDNAEGCVDKPILAIGPDRADAKQDALYVFYFSSAKEKLKVVKSTDGGATFGASVDVGDGAFADAIVTSSGKIHVVYVSGGGDKLGSVDNQVMYTNSADGGATWSAPVRVSTAEEPVPFYNASPRILADAKNAVLYATYPAGTPDGKWNIVLAASRDGGATWERTFANDDAAAGCASHMAPAAALDEKTGRVHVTWYENRTGKGALVHGSCAAGKKKLECAANETVSDTPFAAYGLVRHSAKWLGDYHTLVFDQKRRVLHALWTQPVDENGAAMVRIHHASAKVK